jgi:hypothetical protein
MNLHANCPVMRECSVYRNDIQHNELIGFTYKALYCLQGNKKYVTCKRYQAFLKTGRQCTNNVLPNSCISVDEITELR